MYVIGGIERLGLVSNERWKMAHEVMQCQHRTAKQSRWMVASDGSWFKKGKEMRRGRGAKSRTDARRDGQIMYDTTKRRTSGGFWRYGTVRRGQQAMGGYVARNTLFLGKYSEKIETGGDYGTGRVMILARGTGYGLQSLAWPGSQQVGDGGRAPE